MQPKPTCPKSPRLTSRTPSESEERLASCLDTTTARLLRASRAFPLTTGLSLRQKRFRERRHYHGKANKVGDKPAQSWLKQERMQTRTAEMLGAQTTCCSCRGPDFSSQHVGSQPSIIQFQESDMLPNSMGPRHIQDIHTYADKTLMHRKLK